MTNLRPYSCESCKGTGKVVSQRTRVLQGVKRTCEFLVDCPCKLTELLFTGLPETCSRRKSWTG
jgi:hypothetical protein